MSNKRLGRHAVVVCLLMVALLAGTAAASPVSPNALPAFDQKVAARVDADRAREHVRVLSEDIGPRPGGMDAEWEGAGYITSVLEGYGYQVELQTFPVSDQYLGSISFPNGDEWQVGASSSGAITGDQVVQGQLISAGRGLSPEEFPPDTEGKIVLLEYVSAQRNLQVANAIAAGARAVILYSVIGSRGNYGSAFSPSLASTVGVPVVGAAYVQGQRLLQMLAEGTVEIGVQTRRYANLTSLNVIGTRPASSGDPQAPALLVTAHMDSVVAAPGANDNASGVALLLELARVMRSYNIDKELRFIAFGSEERGLLGSRYYVSSLTEEEASRIVGVFNADMVATSYPLVTHLYAMTVDGQPNLVTDAAEAAGARLGNSSLLPGRFGSSDHVPFHQRGIPAALFIWMRVDSWNPLVYYIEKVYHTPQDTIEENISVARLQAALEIMGAAIFDVIRKDVPALDRSALRNAG